jgi:hypothetical protein
MKIYQANIDAGTAAAAAGAAADFLRDSIANHPAWELAETVANTGTGRTHVLRCLGSASGKAKNYHLGINLTASSSTSINISAFEDYDPATKLVGRYIGFQAASGVRVAACNQGDDSYVGATRHVANSFYPTINTAGSIFGLALTATATFALTVVVTNTTVYVVWAPLGNPARFIFGEVVDRPAGSQHKGEITWGQVALADAAGSTSFDAQQVTRCAAGQAGAGHPGVRNLPLAAPVLQAGTDFNLGAPLYARVGTVVGSTWSYLGTWKNVVHFASPYTLGNTALIAGEAYWCLGAGYWVKGVPS